MKASQQDWSMSNQSVQLQPSKGKTAVLSDHVTQTKDGLLCGVDMVLTRDEYCELSLGSTDLQRSDWKQFLEPEAFRVGVSLSLSMRKFTSEEDTVV